MREVPKLPLDYSYPGSSYTELLAGLFGEEVSPEEIWERLTTEEGLLHQISELLSQAASQGLAPELLEEIGEIAAELGRPDLSSALSAALEKGDVKEAEEVVAAAMEGVATAQRELSSTPQGSSEETPSGSSLEENSSARANEPSGQPMGEIVMDIEAEDRVSAGERWTRMEEEGMGQGAGWEHGELISLASPLSPPEVEEIVSVPVQPGEGPARQDFVLALPGETPEEALSPSETSFSAEAELILSGRDLPPELRDLVRRYFQILVEGGNP